MYFRLFLRNIKRRIRDYFIYFLALGLSVCIFYVFNSISYQKATINFSQVQRQLLASFSTYISITSVLLSLILGFLIIYANNFMIKKRTKEFGMYMSLGMSKRHISLILLCEMLIIGIISLITGLLLGVILSQGLGALTVKLFIVEPCVYKFAFSVEAMVKTIICFGIMFFLVILSNLFFISKHKLVDLLNSSKKNQKLKINNMYISIFLFLLSILCIILAYYLILQNGISIINKSFFTSIILIVIGTFLFFMSLSRLVLKFMMKRKKFYFKSLNIFIIRQLNSNINIAFISMSVICIMLSFTIIILSKALTIKGEFEKNVGFATPYDVSLSINTAQKHSVIKTLKGLGLIIDNFPIEYTEYYEYNTPIMFKSILGNTADTSIKRKYEYLMNTFIPSIKISDYNKLAKMQKLKELQLNNNEILFLSNCRVFIAPINEFTRTNTYLKINGIDFKVKSDATVYNSIETTISPVNYLMLILPDEAVTSLASSRSVVAMNYIGDKRKIEETLINAYVNKYKIDEISKHVYWTSVNNY
jgi:putative ABC transport system permease protein